MGKVYVVTCGEYSDYRIKACFSTRELAEAYINAPDVEIEPSYGDACEIEEYNLDEEPRTEWRIEAWIDVRTREVVTRLCSGGDRGTEDWLYAGGGHSLHGQFEVDKANAVPKILNDKLSKILAMHGSVEFGAVYHRDTLERRDKGL